MLNGESRGLSGEGGEFGVGNGEFDREIGEFVGKTGGVETF